MKSPFRASMEAIISNPRARKKIGISVASLLLLLIALHWLYDKASVSTDDAYVNAHVLQVATQVTGEIIALPIEDNRTVKSGDLLLEIDPVPFEIAVKQAQENLKLVRLEVQQAEAEVRAATASLAERKIELENIQLTSNRIMALVQKKVLSNQGGDDADTKVKKAKEAVREAEANLEKARLALGLIGEDNDHIQLAKAKLAEAELNLQYTKVYAKDSGQISQLTIRKGDMATAYQPLFALISHRDFWVDANFKETDLENIRPGQTAVIDIDMYPNNSFQGLVDSISGGSGTAFSLLPPENATGNWVKVTQRVPVKVKITNVDVAYPLRIGTSASVTIYTP